ncbi:MAG: translation initiation factor, partial [Roseomonas sp.]|nr:translation initiation factor [Roseomonas sp.]
MSDQNEQDPGKSRLSLRPGGRLEIGKTVDAGSVRQSFSHGRSKTVQVEVVKKRAPGAPAPAQKPGGPVASGPRPAGGPPRGASGPQRGGASSAPSNRPLNQGEQATRLRVLEEHRRQEAQREREARERQALMLRSAAEEAARKAEDDRRAAEEAVTRAAEESRQKAEDERRRKADEESRRDAPQQVARPVSRDQAPRDGGRDAVQAPRPAAAGAPARAGGPGA